MEGPPEGSTLHAQLVALAVPEFGHLGLELIELKVLRGGGRLTLRFTVESAKYDPKVKGSGASVGACAKASRMIGRLLEAEGEEFIPVRYLLEVSTPGIFRELRTEADFVLHQGLRARLTVDSDGKKAEVRGTIAGANAESIELDVGADNLQAIAWGDMVKAKLDPVIESGKAKENKAPRRKGR